MSNPLIFIIGPTATGKSDLAFDLAVQLNGQVMNCDSVQSYSEVEIGAAKPDAKARERIPHLLYDWVKPPHKLTAAEFRRQALRVLPEALSRGPVFGVGGSGFYIQALEKGMYPVAKPTKEVQDSLQQQLAELGSEALHEHLRELDPEYAKKINPSDSYRILRGLSIIKSEGQTVTAIQKQFDERPPSLPFPHFKVALYLSREELREKVEARTQAMVQAGLLDEVRSLMAKGLAEWSPLKSVGYLEAVQAVRSELPEGELHSAIVTSTMQLAKKQMTWFRRDRNIRWFHAQTEREECIKYVRRIVERST